MTREYSPQLGVVVLPEVWLTRSERTVLQLLANGRTVAAAAAELGLTRHTVNTHRNNLYRKLGAHSLLEAVETALRLRLLAREDIVAGPIADRWRIKELEAQVLKLQAQIAGLEAGR